MNFDDLVFTGKLVVGISMSRTLMQDGKANSVAEIDINHNISHAFFCCWFWMSLMSWSDDFIRVSLALWNTCTGFADMHTVTVLCKKYNCLYEIDINH